MNWVQFWSTFLGVLVASLAVSFFSIMWQKANKSDKLEQDIQLLRSVDQELTKKIAVQKARNDAIAGPASEEEYKATIVEEAEKEIQKAIDDRLWREKELMK